MSPTERRSGDQRHDDLVERTAAPMRGEQQEDLPPSKYRTADSAAADPVAARREQQREMDTAAAKVGPTGGVMTDAQGRGAIVGGIVGGCIGLVLMVGFAFIPIADTSLTGRLLLFAIVGVMAGSAAGAVYGGGRAPELEGEATDVERTTRDADGSLTGTVDPERNVQQTGPVPPHDSTR